MAKKLRDMLLTGARGLGVELTDMQADKFLVYLDELLLWNEKINITAITDESEVVTRHFLDSLVLLPHIKRLGIRSILDIGSGAGFPGLPLKIAEPGLNVVLMDSSQKKVYFIRHIIRKLGLDKEGAVEAVSSRAEEKATIKKYGASFDGVASRALSDLSEVVKLSLPYLRPNGYIIAVKGPSVYEEVCALKTGGTPELIEADVPFTDRKTILAILRADS